MDWSDVRRLTRRRSRHRQEADDRIVLHWRSEHDGAVQVLRFVRGHEDALTLVVEVCPLSWLPPGAAQRAARHLKFSALLANQGMWVLRRVVPLARVAAEEIDALVDWMVHEANWVRKHGAAFRSDARPMNAYVETA